MMWYVHMNYEYTNNKMSRSTQNPDGLVVTGPTRPSSYIPGWFHEWLMKIDHELADLEGHVVDSGHVFF